MGQARLFGTVTSPYVRRVRIVAIELGVDLKLVDTAVDAGQEELRQISPIWKIPVLEYDRSETIYDSQVINDELLRRHGPGPLTPTESITTDQRNAITVIDGALDALINVFYLARDGVRDNIAYVTKQRQRAAAAMSWLEARVDTGSQFATEGLGLVDIALATTVGWMLFRRTYPIDHHPGLMRIYEKHASRPSFQTTAPPPA